MRDRIEIGYRTNDYILIPTIGILDMDAQYFMSKNKYAYRLSFAFWNFRMSIGLGKARW